MIEYNFKSQPATTIEQSQMLLALGLKKETADMCYRYVNTIKGEKKYELIVEAAWSQEVIDKYVRFGTKIGLFDNLVHPCGKPVTPLEARADVTKNDIPAWSLHRLIELCPVSIRRLGYHYSLIYDIHRDWVVYMLYANGNNKPYNRYLWESQNTNIYDAFIDCIEWLIKEGYFPKEYLV